MTMPNNLQEQLPAIIAEGRRVAECAVKRFAAAGGDAALHTTEWVFPTPPDGLPGMPANTRRSASPNRLIHGDSLHAAAALLAGDAQQASLRGRIGLILADPQASGISCAASDVACRLAAIVPRLLLMRELLSRNGAIYIRLDELVMPYVAAMVDEVFGPTIAVHAFTGGDGEPSRHATLPSDEVLDAVILVASDRHMVVADFLGDFGRGAVAAARYGRRWIAADRDEAACQLMRRRLRGYSTDPFLCQAVA